MIASLSYYSRRSLRCKQLPILSSSVSDPPCWSPSFPMSSSALHWLLLLCLEVLLLRYSLHRGLADVQSPSCTLQMDHILVDHGVMTNSTELQFFLTQMNPFFLVIFCCDVGLDINKNPIYVHHLIWSVDFHWSAREEVSLFECHQLLTKFAHLSI